MAVNLDQMAQQAQAQGQQMLQNYQNNASNYKGQYNQYQQQADAANQAVKNYTDYMQGAGSAGNQYDTAFNQQKQDLGYDPAQMTQARANLNQATGALSAYSDFANTAASKFGLNAGGFAAANAGALSGLNNNIASNQNVVNGLSDLYKTAQTGANQKTGLVIQGEHETLGGLQQTFANAANQRDSAASMMNFYDNLASQQGGLNAQQHQYYAQAKQAYAQAQSAMAQAALLASQTTAQNLANQQTQNAMNAKSPSPIAKNSGVSSGAKPAASAAPKVNYAAPSTYYNDLKSTLSANPSLKNTAEGVGDVFGLAGTGIAKGVSKLWSGL